MKTQEILDGYIEETKELIQMAKNIQKHSLETLEHRPNPKAWNTLECIEHLNYYIDLYNEFFREALYKANHPAKDNDVHKAGFLGGKFIKLMRPETSKSKMSTFKKTDPQGKPLELDVIDYFIAHCEKLIERLEEAKTKDLSRIKSRLAIPILRLKVVDAIGFIVAHNARHLKQIERTLASAGQVV